MREWSEKKMRKIAKAFVTRSMRIGRMPDGKYDSVRITYNPTDPTCEEFALAVEEECWRQGAHALLLTHRSGRERVRYELAPRDSLREMSPFAEAIAKKADALVFIGEEDEPNWAMGIPDRVKLTASIRQRLREITDRRKVRWAYFGWPLPATAEAYGCPVEKFRGIFFKSIESTFTGKFLKICRYYRAALAGKDEIRITADDGTDLILSIEGRPILVDDGMISKEDIERGDVGVNIPAGEVFMAPLETTAKGEISFERAAIPGFGELEHLWLKFKKGKVTSYKAERGRENFRRFLEANTGEKDRIAEFGIGCNPGAEYTGGSIIVDEKIFGTVHIAIGNNQGAYHGRNKASSHLDLIKDMTEGQVFANGTIIMDGGKPAQLKI
ncbi:MAG: aminopeptidase [Candidatus Hodarchaeaceae archaeon]|nr:aminopeptidase [Candidatus Hodarchaeaceae archaeon]